MRYSAVDTQLYVRNHKFMHKKQENCDIWKNQGNNPLCHFWIKYKLCMQSSNIFTNNYWLNACFCYLLGQTCVFQPHFYAKPKICLRRHVSRMPASGYNQPAVSSKISVFKCKTIQIIEPESFKAEDLYRISTG